MSLKRNVLEHFKRDELLVAVDRFELAVPDRRVRAALVDALAGSRRAKLVEILGDLRRDRLQEICRAMGLDDSGREKAVLVARLVGETPATPPAPAEVAPSSIDRVPPPRASYPSGRWPARPPKGGDLRRRAERREPAVGILLGHETLRA